VSPTTGPLRVRTSAELLSMEIPPRGMVLDPIIPEKGLAMIYSQRGVGKTWFALSLAYAVAAGAPILRFSASVARRVLYVDGEMPLPATKERLARVVSSFDKAAEPESFRLLSADDQEMGIPDLASREGQAAIEPHLQGVDLVVLDNLSTLYRSGRENEAESWGPVQEWALGQRRAGRSLLFIHHAGKGGAQRGTSRREDVLDTVISLKRPSDYSADQGARFEVHFEKARGIAGEDVLPFEARCELVHDRLSWTEKSLTNANLDRVAGLHADGLSVREIAEETGLSKSAVHRLIIKLARGPNDRLH
jgi:putative DNA primase/helicase